VTGAGRKNPHVSHGLQLIPSNVRGGNTAWITLRSRDSPTLTTTWRERALRISHEWILIKCSHSNKSTTYKKSRILHAQTWYCANMTCVGVGGVPGDWYTHVHCESALLQLKRVMVSFCPSCSLSYPHGCTIWPRRSTIWFLRAATGLTSKILCSLLTCIS